MLHDIHAFPYPLIEYYPGKIASDKYNINVFWFWLTHGEWSPLINRQQQSFTFNHHDSIPKVLVFIVSWLLLIVLQLLSLLPYALFLGVVMLPYYATMLLVGCFFFQTKLLIYTPVWNTYMYLFTGKTNVFDKRGIDFDTSLLNESFFVQLLLLAIPQVIIKGINNTLVANDSAITPVYSLSLSVSVIAAAIGLYRYIVIHDSMEFGLAKGTYDVRNNHELQELHKASLLYIVPSYELEYASRNYNYIIDKCLILDSEAVQGFKMELFNSLRQRSTHPLSSMKTSITDRVFQLLIHDSVDLSMYRYLRSVNITSPVDLLNGCSIDIIRGILHRINDKKVRKLVENYLRLLAHNTADEGVRDSIVSFTAHHIIDALTGNNNGSNKKPRMVVFDIESSKYNQIELIEVSSDFINVSSPSDLNNQEVPQATSK
jgi:hypothetical protein